MNYKRKSGKAFKKSSGLFVWTVVLILMAAIAAGGAEHSAVVAAPGRPAESGDVVSGGGAGAASGQAKIQSISINKDETIRDALRVLSAMYQKNIVPYGNVDGVLGFTKLRNVTFEQAMDAVLGPDFRYEQDGNLVKVYTAARYKEIKADKDRMIYKSFTLYYTTAKEAKKLILPVLSAEGSIEATTAAQTGVPTGQSISSPTQAGDTMAMNDTIIIFDFPEKIAEAEKLIAIVDVRPQQVLIEATILSATLTEDMEFGIDWSSLGGVVSQIPGVTAATGDIARGASDYFKSAGTSQITKSGGMTIGLAHDNIAAFIRAVEEVTDITILANPKILATNKQLGQVYIGTKIGYKSQTTVSEGGTSTEQVTFLDTGTKLSFRPYIANDGYIRMDIHSKDSSGEFNAQNVPDETSAELVTNIMVKDGQTIVLGGLFRDKITNKKTQIPILGDLPLIGFLFRGTADKSVRQEVMILLTPHIVSEVEEMLGDARAADIARKRIGAKDAIQGTGRARLAEDFYVKAAGHYENNETERAIDALNVALTIRPTYLDALRLKERIIRETDPEAAMKIERILLERVEQQDTEMWLRR